MTDLSQTYSELVTTEDLHAGASVADESNGAEDCGLVPLAVAEFLTDTKSLWDGREVFEGILWGICIGIMAERHRIHREEHRAMTPAVDWPDGSDGGWRDPEASR